MQHLHVQRGLGLHPLSSPHTGCWQGNQTGRQNRSQMLTAHLALTTWTSTPSGGQRKDQHKVLWGKRLHPNLAQQWSALWHKISLLKISSSVEIYLLKDCLFLMTLPINLQVVVFTSLWFLLLVSLFSVVSTSGCLATSDLSCFTKNGGTIFDLEVSVQKKRDEILFSILMFLNCTCSRRALPWVECSF